MINKDTIINDALFQNIKVQFILMKYNMGCANCSMRFEETIEVGAKCHNVDVEKLLAELNEAD